MNTEMAKSISKFYVETREPMLRAFFSAEISAIIAKRPIEATELGLCYLTRSLVTIILCSIGTAEYCSTDLYLDYSDAPLLPKSRKKKYIR